MSVTKRVRLVSIGMAMLVVGTAACGSKGSGSDSASGSARPAKTSAAAKPTVTEPAEPPRPTSPFDLPGDPFAGEQADPGDEIEIPGAKGYFVTAPKGWTAQKDAPNGNAVLIPASGTAKVVVAAGPVSALDARVTKLLQESMTHEETWKPEVDTSIGAGAIAAKYARGIGYQGFPGGRREPHKLLRVRIPTDIADPKGDPNNAVTIQALAKWNGADVETEVAVVDAVKGIHKK